MPLLHLIFSINGLSCLAPFFSWYYFWSSEDRKRERESTLSDYSRIRLYDRIREVEENPRSGGTNQLTDRSLQDMTLKHRSLLMVQVKRRRNITVGVSSVIVGHEAATLMLLQALLVNNFAYGSALSLLVSVLASARRVSSIIAPWKSLHREFMPFREINFEKSKHSLPKKKRKKNSAKIMCKID